MDSDRNPDYSQIGGFNAGVESLCTFLRERFRSEPEAASFIGGPQGKQAVLNEDEFSRGLRIAGYREPTERLFRHFVDERSGGVRVSDLLRGAGLTREPTSSLNFGITAPSSYEFAGGLSQKSGIGSATADDGGTLPVRGGTVENIEVTTYLPDRAVQDVVAAADRQLRSEVDDLRREVAKLRARTDQSVTREHLLEEKSGREIGEGAMRQLSAKLEEALARETVALRADNADLRASLTEALRLLAEERMERMNYVSQTDVRIREIQHWAEEKTANLENMSRGNEMHATENKTSLQEVEQLLQMSELRVMSALAEETRAREASVQREQQLRETTSAETEAHWRTLLNEERQLRSKEHDSLNSQIVRCEDNFRTEREMHAQRISEIHVRIEETSNEVRDEARQRQAELNHVSMGLDSAHKKVDQEGRDRRDMNADHSKRHENLNRNMKEEVERHDKELTLLKQTCLDLRAACQVESTAREEGVARLHALLAEEARMREEGLMREGSSRLTLEKALEQHTRAMMNEEKKILEDATAIIEAKVAALQHEHNFEKSKGSAQARELAAALAQVREALQNESAARRNDSNALTKGFEELRDSFEQEKATRDKAETRVLEQVGTLDMIVRDEAAARQATERKVMGAHGELKDNHSKHARTLEELEASLVRRLNEMDRLREEGDEQERREREEQDGAYFAKVQELLDRLVSDHELLKRMHEHGVAADEQARNVERGEREEREKVLNGRITEVHDQLAETRRRIREALTSSEELTKIHELVMDETKARQEQETRLELVLKEQQVRVDHLAQSHNNAVRKHEQRHADLHERLEGEATSRGNHLAEINQQILEERDARELRHKEERRHLEGIIGEHQKALHERIDEERALRDSALGVHAAKAHEHREAIEEVRRWRVEQYNELCSQVSKVAEMLNEEAKSRQQQDHVLSGELVRLREEVGEEQGTRRKALDAWQDELRDVLARLEKHRETSVGKDKDHAQAMENLRNAAAIEVSKREAAIAELRGLIDREVLTREEVVSGATRAWQRAQQKTNDDWRLAVRSEATALEQLSQKIDQELQEVKSATRETRALLEQAEEDNQHRFKAAADAVAVEERARKTEDLLLHEQAKEVRGLIATEQAQRESNEQHTADRFLVVEEQLREERVARENTKQNIEKELLDFKVKLKEERGSREDHHLKFDKALTAMAANHEEVVSRERTVREQKYSDVLETIKKSFATEQTARQSDRQELMGLYQTLQREQHQEHEERVKGDRELSAGLARLQSLEKEEEESRIEQNERFAADILALQESVRGLNQLKEEAVKRCMEGVDEVKAIVHKETSARIAKIEGLDEVAKELKRRVQDEVSVREASYRQMADLIAQERSSREEALQRERRLAEEEVQKATHEARKAREVEERRLQEQVIQLSAGISQERDARQEGLRQDRQKLHDAKEELQREMKGIENSLTKMTQHVTKHHEDHARRTDEAVQHATRTAEKLDCHRNEFFSEAQKRDAHVSQLMKQHADLDKKLELHTKEKKDGHVDLRRFVEEELASMNAALAADRRAREAGDLQLTSTLKSALREEIEAREHGYSTVAKDLQAVRTQLEQESGHREDDHSRNQAAMQKLRQDMGDMQSERKVDAMAMREALGQVTEQMQEVQRARREDVERLDAAVSGLVNRYEQGAKISRDGTIALEHAMQLLQTEVQKEKDAHASLMSKVEVRLAEERRLLEASLHNEGKLREEQRLQIVDSLNQKLGDDSRKHSSNFEKLQASLHEIMDELNKESELSNGRARELSRGIAALQNLHTSEEQARQQGTHQLQQAIDAVREELASETKERRSHIAKHAEDVQVLHKGLQLRDDKVEAMHQKLSADHSEIRDRVLREVRAREAALMQMEQRALAIQAKAEAAPRVVADGTLQSGGNLVAGGGDAALELRDHKNQVADDFMKHRRQIEGVTAEHEALVKTVGNLTERVDAMRSGLSGVQAAIGDVVVKQKVLDNTDLELKATRDELKKESVERRTEDERITRVHGDIEHKLEKTDQQRILGEDRLKQDILQVKAAFGKSLREQTAIVEKLEIRIREEGEKREEAVVREGRMRLEGQESTKDAFHSAIREERRVREKEILRLDGRQPALTAGGKPGESGVESLAVQMDVRALRQAIGDTQDRLVQVESRQRSAEERTVSMLDALMTGLQTPGD